jgi:alpha-glucoside transport system permease protein
VVFVVVIALIVVPIQVAIIPDAQIFKQLGVYGQIPAVVSFHVAFGLPFAIFRPCRCSPYQEAVPMY